MIQDNLTVSIIQTDITWENKAKNLEMFAEKVRACGSYSDIILLPEMFTTGFSMHAIPRCGAVWAHEPVCLHRLVQRGGATAVCGAVAVAGRPRHGVGGRAESVLPIHGRRRLHRMDIDAAGLRAVDLPHVALPREPRSALHAAGAGGGPDHRLGGVWRAVAARALCGRRALDGGAGGQRVWWPGLGGHDGPAARRPVAY